MFLLPSFLTSMIPDLASLFSCFHSVIFDMSVLRASLMPSRSFSPSSRTCRIFLSSSVGSNLVSGGIAMVMFCFFPSIASSSRITFFLLDIRNAVYVARIM